jgi:hypothetical protein
MEKQSKVFSKPGCISLVLNIAALTPKLIVSKPTIFEALKVVAEAKDIKSLKATKFAKANTQVLLTFLVNARAALKDALFRVSILSFRA